MDHFTFTVVKKGTMKSPRWVFWAFVAVSVLLGIAFTLLLNKITAEVVLNGVGFVLGILPGTLLFGFCFWMFLYLGLYLRVIEPRRDEARHRQGVGDPVDVEVRFDAGTLTIVYLLGGEDEGDTVANSVRVGGTTYHIHGTESAGPRNQRLELEPKDLGGLRYLGDFEGGGIEIEYRRSRSDKFSTERWSLIQVDEATKSQFLERLDRYAREHLSTSIYDGARPEPVDEPGSGEGAASSKADSNDTALANASPFEESSKDRSRSGRSRTSRRSTRQRSSRRGAKSRTAQKRDPIALALDLEELEAEPYWRDQIRNKAFGSDLKICVLCLLSVLCWGGFLVYSLNDVENAGWGLVIVLAVLTLFSLFVLYIMVSQSIKEYRTGAALPRVLVGQDKLVYFTGDHDYQVWDSVVDGIKCICQISDYEVRNGYTVEDKVIVVRGHFNEEVTDPTSDSSDRRHYKTVSTAEFSISRIYKQEDKLLACLDRLKQA